MKNVAISILLVLLTGSASKAQQFYTKNGSISFFSKTPMENIDAKNNQVLSTLVLPAGDFKFSLNVKDFHFKKALMEEHFNENYMESGKFPKSTFTGKITDAGKVNLSNDGDYRVTVSGDLTLHGITRKISVPGTLSVRSGKLSAQSTFSILLADYQVSIPDMVADKIAKTIDISVSCTYDRK